MSPANDPDDHVVPFRRRGLPVPHNAPPASPVEDLGKYERTKPESDDEYRQRMIVNVLAAVFVVLLVAAGWWIADTMAQMRKNQDCVLSGRRTCAPVPPPG